MLRVPLKKAWVQRGLKINYGWTQATPKAMFLDPAWDRSVDIYPGMVAMKTTGDLVTLINGTTNARPYGLFGNFIGGEGIDELIDAGVNACAVWVLGPDAEITIQSPGFDQTLSWTDPGDGTIKLVHAQTAGATRGKLVPAGTSGASSAPVARLLRVDSADQIVIGGLVPTS
jgi:hypothetical protein